MPDPAPITFWHWAGFILVILVFLALDLGVFHQTPGVVKTKDALRWSAVWFLLAVLFAGVLGQWRSPEESLQFVTGYFVEYALSMDNVVAIALIFAYFNTAPELQHRVLFWGILGALMTRGMMIAVGAVLIQEFQWVLCVLGAFLVFTGVKWAFAKKAPVQPEKNRLLRLARKILPVSSGYDGGKFLTWENGRRALTPLALVLLMVEMTDLLFAVDSIPAVFAVTQKPFIVFTSNIFAVLGLRSLYFALAGAMQYFRFLKTGLAGVLVFVGFKMLAARWVSVPTVLSLAIVAAIIGLSIALSIRSVLAQKRA